ncbi:hypothetical protein MMC08_008060 [Hypocenomyce scalaris]|nr:hypothetical protein [Hypocenomyce scalaris]
MSKTIVVFGATGVQGGGVVKELLKDQTWKIRGVTRNTSSETAQALSSQGVEMVTAHFDDTESLVKACEGAHAIFAVTNFWEHIFTNGPIRAGEIEYAQALNLFRAASSSLPTLTHLIWSTLPSAMTATGGAHYVPHLESKAQADTYLQRELPALAAKTTFLWLGFYGTNVAYFPPLKPTPLATAAGGKSIWIQPCSADTVLPIAGDAGVNTGVYVRAILARPEVSLPAKYALVQTEALTMGQMLRVWERVTGKEAGFLECTLQEYDGLWPVLGKELGLQLRFNQAVPDWGGLREGMVTGGELGIREGLVGFEEALKGLVAFWE